MAKRFQFRLEPVLRLRGQEEESRQREFADVQRRVVEQEERIESLGEEKSANQARLVDLYREGGNIEAVVEHQRYINTLDIRRAYASRELQRHQAELEKRRQALLEARKKRRGLELLKERRQAEYRRGVEAEEARYLDELSLQNFRAEHGDEAEVR
jgi:flagellar FliJ protein